MVKTIIQNCKAIGWSEPRKETIERLAYFVKEFRNAIPVKFISDNDLIKHTVMAFGLYGENHVWDIFTINNDEICGEKPLRVKYLEFKDAMYQSINKPERFENYERWDEFLYVFCIDLYIEFVYSILLKR